MEHTDEIKKEKNPNEIWIKVAMMIAIYVAIALFLSTVIILVKNIDEIKTDPIVYGIKKNDFLVCTCYNEFGGSTTYGQEGIIIEKDYGFNLNLK